MTAIEERKAKYENSALRILLESQGHEICRRCYCCEFVWERATCWACGGMEDDDPDLYVIAVCSECNGEGETSFQVCIGRCDENGNHARKQTASGQGSMTSQSKPQTMPEERESGKGVREDAKN